MKEVHASIDGYFFNLMELLTNTENESSVKSLNLSTVYLDLPLITSTATGKVKTNLQGAVSTFFTILIGESVPGSDFSRLKFLTASSLSVFDRLLWDLSDSITSISIPPQNMILLSVSYPLLIISMFSMMVCTYRSIYNESSCLKNVIIGVSVEDCKDMLARCSRFSEIIKDENEIMKKQMERMENYQESAEKKKDNHTNLKMKLPLLKVGNGQGREEDEADFEATPQINRERTGNGTGRQKLEGELGLSLYKNTEGEGLLDKNANENNREQGFGQTQGSIGKKKDARKTFKETGSSIEDAEDEETEKQLQSMARRAFFSHLWKITVSFLMIITLLTAVLVMEILKRNQSRDTVQTVKNLYRIRGDLRYMQAIIFDDKRNSIKSIID